MTIEMQKFSFIIISLLWLVGGSLRAQEFSAFVSKREVAVGETFKLTFQLVNGDGGTLEPPDLSAFQLRGGPERARSTTMVNGKVSQTMTLGYYLQATKTGDFTIGPATIKSRSGTLQSEPVTIKVVAARSSGSGGSSGGGANNREANDASLDEQLKDAVFLQAVVSDRSVYQGEPLTVTYQLYTRVPISSPVQDASPSYEGFWLEGVDLRRQAPRLEVKNGVRYQVETLRQDVLFPQRSGKLRIEPLKVSTNVRVEVAADPSRQRSIFDQFYRRYENYRYSFASNPINIEVKPLPGTAPGTFNGLVGNLSLQASLDTTRVEAGEPLTFNLRIEGRGNLKKLREPQLKLPPDFEVYDPTITENISLSGGTLRGWRNYEYLIIPRNPGTYTLPPIEVAYFDLEDRRFRTLSSPEVDLEVTGDPVRGTAGNGGTPSTEPSLLNQDIRYIETAAPQLREGGSTLLNRAWYWLLWLLPIGGGVALYLLRKRQAQTRRDVAGTRRRKAAKVAQKRLKVAQAHLEADQAKEFYDEVARATWGYLGDKFSLRPSELTRERAAQLLQQRGASEAQVGQLNQLLDTCEMALYAPSAAPGGMAGTYQQATQLITDLEEI